MNDAHHKLMCYSGVVKGPFAYKFNSVYYVCVPSEEANKTLYLRKDRSIENNTGTSNSNITGYWSSFDEATSALLEFKQDYKAKRKTNKNIKHKGRSFLVRAGLFKLNKGII